MNKVEFVTMSGMDVEVNQDLLIVEKVNNRAALRFGTEVVCIPGVFGIGTVCAGWKILKKEDASVLGYLVLTTGWILEPSDFEYGVSLFVPFSSEWSRIFCYDVRYFNGELQVVKH